MFDPLEQRRLLTIPVSGGIASVTGTSGDDVLELIVSSGVLQLRNAAGTVVDSVSASSVTGISVNAGGGNDFVRLGRADGTLMPAVPATIRGGAGNDTLTGGNRDDQIFGETENDRLDGRAGRDLLDGGGGFDTGDYSYRTVPVDVTVGNSTTANDGSNSGDNSSPARYNDLGADNLRDVEAVIGGAASDRLVGNAAANWFDGGGGNDSIYGGAGIDTVYGGAGADLAYGEDGDDYFFVKDTLGDRFLGGAGAAYAQYDSGVDSPAPALSSSPSSTLARAGLAGGDATYSRLGRGAADLLLLDVDTTFGPDANGKVVTDIAGTVAQVNGVALQRVQTAPGVFEDKIVAVGTAIGPRGDYDFFLVRYNADGSLDTTFGPNRDGKVFVDFSTGSGFNYDVASSLAITEGGKIVVAGGSYKRGDLDNSTLRGFADYAIARFTADGALDTSFSGDGLVMLDLGGPQSDDRAARVAIQKVNTASGVEDRYVVSGTLGLAFKNANPQFPTADFGIVRLTSSGAQDSAFGLIRASFGPASVTQDYNTGLAIDPATNNIWVSGYTGRNAAGFDFAVAGYTASGAAIAGSARTLDLGGADRAYDTAIDGSQLLVVGDSASTTGTRGAIAAFNITAAAPGALLDSALVSDASSQAVQFQGITLDGQGHGIAVGSLGGGDFYAYRFTAADLQAYGVGGVVDFAGTPDGAFDVAVQPDGKIVLAGLAGGEAGLARLEPKTWIDFTLSDEDVQNFAFTYIDEDGNPQPIPDYLIQRIRALQPDGTLVLTGSIGPDAISLTQSGGVITADINGELVQVSAALVTRVIVRGLDGDDVIATDGSIGVPVTFEGDGGNDLLVGGTGAERLLGGDGDDLLRGGGGDDVLLGGGGDDVLIGGGGDDEADGGDGRDILIGGAGADRLLGGGGDDILIGGYTTYDDDATALSFIAAEWRTTLRAYQNRIANLNGTGAGNGLNGNYYLRPGNSSAKTVYDDGATDVLSGGDGLDWFLAATKRQADLVLDRQTGENLTQI